MSRVSEPSNSRSVSDTVAAHRARQDQDYLFNTGLWIEMLTEAFKLLPNLETLDIRDFNSKTRFRDGRDAQWYSYGSTTIFKACGVRPPLKSNDFNLDRLFQGIVVAAGRAELTAPNLEVITRLSALTDAFYVSPAIKPAVAKYLGQLKKLHLVLYSAEPEPLEEFLHLTKNVMYLRVNYSTRHFNPEAFLEWLGTPCNNDTMDDWAKALALAVKDNKELPIAPLDLPLDTLELGGCAISASSLESIVSKLPLRSLSMRRVQLCPEPKGDTTKLWAHFLESLEGGGVRSLHLSEVTESAGPGLWGQAVTFKGGRFPKDLWLPARRYRSEMFKSAAADVVVEPPPSYDSDDDSDMGSGDDDDDDEEDDDDDNVDADGAANGNANGDGDDNADEDVDMSGDDE